MKVLGFFAPDKENGYLSNWYPCKFKYGRYVYQSAEQFMMAQKALLFDDSEVFDKIMVSNNQKTIKRLGKQVKNYDDEIWSCLRGKIMQRGIRAKFQQNSDILNTLLETDGMILAECSPYDKIWGIGLGVDDIRIQDTSKWKGKNLLGNVLMEVRADLKNWVSRVSDILYIDAVDSTANDIWNMTPSEAYKIPKIKEAIDIYNKVVKYTLKSDFLAYSGTFSDLENELRTNANNDFPKMWFYEMKQEIYDVVRFGVE